MIFPSLVLSILIAQVPNAAHSPEPGIPLIGSPLSIPADSKGVVLQIYDVRDLLEPSPIDLKFGVDSLADGSGDAERLLAEDRLVNQASRRLVEHFERFLARNDPGWPELRTVTLASGGALVVRATPWSHEYIAAVLNRARAIRAGVGEPMMRIEIFSIAPDLAMEHGIDGTGAQIVTDLELGRFWAKQLNSSEPPIPREPGLFEAGGLAVSGNLGVFFDRGADHRGRVVERYVTGYRRVDHVWPDDRVVFVPEIFEQKGGVLRCAAIPLPGSGFELDVAVEHVRVLDVKEGVAEGGPIAEPTRREFHFESRLAMEPGNWVFSTVERGEKMWSVVAIWLTPVVDGRATTEYPK